MRPKHRAKRYRGKHDRRHPPSLLTRVWGDFSTTEALSAVVVTTDTATKGRTLDEYIDKYRTTATPEELAVFDDYVDYFSLASQILEAERFIARWSQPLTHLHTGGVRRHSAR
jgi:hypothetical protein